MIDYVANNFWIIPITVASILSIILLLWLPYQTYNNGKFKVEERIYFWGPIVILLILISGLILGQSILWVMNIYNPELNTSLYSIHKDPFGSDTARKIYESRSILGLVETLTLAMIAFMLPLLISIWNYARQNLVNKIDNLLNLRGKNDINSTELKKILEDTLQKKELFLNIQRDLQGWFWSIVFLALVLLISLAFTNVPLGFVNSDQLLIIIILQKVLAIILAIWFITFLFIYQFAVNPLITDFDHIKIYNLE